MKTIFRFLSTGVLSAAAVAVMATAGFGQDPTPSANCADIDGHNALYTKFTTVYAAKTLPEQKAALATGKEYLEKYGTCTEAFGDQINFVKPHVARLENITKRGEIVARYDAAVKSDNPTEIAAAGKDFLGLEKESENMNVVLPIALSASYKSTKENNYQYADQGIQYSNMALAKLKGGWALTKKDDKGTPVVGVFQYTYTKENAIAELTYAVAYLNYYGKKNKQAALPLYYELSQSGPFKADPRVYGTVGDYYFEEGRPIGEEIAKLITDQKAATDDAVKADLDTKIKAKIALFNGYTERALDAYSRAYNSAKPGPYKDNLYKVMGNLYKSRFEKDTGLDAYVATTIAKPFPNPTSPVQPVADPETTTTTTTSGSTATVPTTTKPVTTTAPTTTKPVTTTGTPASTKPATGTPTKPVSAVTTKGTVAKKGTRR